MEDLTKIDQALSSREREILLLAAEGETDKEISIALGIAQGTIRTYWERIRTKLEVRSRSHAVARWFTTEFGERRNPQNGVELLDLFLNSATAHALIILDEDGIFTHWNPGVFKLFGYSEEEFVGQNFKLIFVDEDCARGLPDEQLRQAREHGPVRENHLHAKKGGRSVLVEGMLYALWDGSLKGYAKIMSLPEESRG